jgi:hypothetical protein
MNIPFYFDVLMDDIKIYRNQRIGTISYGSNLEYKKTWVEYFKYYFYNYEKESFNRFNWFPNFNYIIIHKECNPSFSILEKDIFISHEYIFGKDFDEEEYRIKKLNYSAWYEMQNRLKFQI